MRILLTNDDGVSSDGIRSLVDELRDIADITVVAPDRERSAAGHALTFFKPLRVHQISKSNGVSIFSSSGTPADCVVLALYDLLEEKPDLLISGINHGQNLGDDLTYSGTVSAAMEGPIRGVPAFAISLHTRPEEFPLAPVTGKRNHFSFAARFARKMALQIVEHGLPRKTFLNINVPNVPEREITGVAITRQGNSIYRDKIEKRLDPRGQAYYWIGGEIPTGRPEENTDFRAIAEKKVSITPICMDFTDYDVLADLRTWNLDP